MNAVPRTHQLLTSTNEAAVGRASDRRQRRERERQARRANRRFSSAGAPPSSEDGFGRALAERTMAEGSPRKTWHHPAAAGSALGDERAQSSRSTSLTPVHFPATWQWQPEYIETSVDEDGRVHYPVTEGRPAIYAAAAVPGRSRDANDPRGRSQPVVAHNSYAAEHGLPDQQFGDGGGGSWEEHDPGLATWRSGGSSEGMTDRSVSQGSMRSGGSTEGSARRYAGWLEHRRGQQHQQPSDADWERNHYWAGGLGGGWQPKQRPEPASHSARQRESQARLRWQHQQQRREYEQHRHKSQLQQKRHVQDREDEVTQQNLFRFSKQVCISVFFRCLPLPFTGLPRPFSGLPPLFIGLSLPLLGPPLPFIGFPPLFIGLSLSLLAAFSRRTTGSRSRPADNCRMGGRSGGAGRTWAGSTTSTGRPRSARSNGLRWRCGRARRCLRSGKRVCVCGAADNVTTSGIELNSTLPKHRAAGSCIGRTRS